MRSNRHTIALKHSLILFLSLCLHMALSSPARAQTFTDLYNFSAGLTDGAHPYGAFTLDGSTLYAMTSSGGRNNAGTVISYNPANPNADTLDYSFGAGSSDGSNPEGSLLQVGSLLYGMTDSGGANSRGTIFTFDPTNNNETVIHPFSSAKTDGTTPGYGSLIQSGANLYGVTRAGGSANDGAVFSISPADSTFNLLYSLGTGPSDGYSPGSGVVAVGSKLYGLTEFGGQNLGPFGGGTQTEGTLYSIDTNNNNRETILHSFGTGATDGTFPQGGLIQSNAILYGYGQNAGAHGKGTIFSYNTATSAYSTLYSFGAVANDGSIPYGDLLLDGSTLYGMTHLGGVHSSDGMVFSFDLDTDTYTILHAFAGTDGATPYGDLTLDGSTLYGMTESGGSHNDGVIFSIVVPEPGTLAILTAMAGGLMMRRRRTSGNST
jgi:uncharacterized repeat protein (TIGR03803 family)